MVLCCVKGFDVDVNQAENPKMRAAGKGLPILTLYMESGFFLGIAGHWFLTFCENSAVLLEINLLNLQPLQFEMNPFIMPVYH